MNRTRVSIRPLALGLPLLALTVVAGACGTTEEERLCLEMADRLARATDRCSAGTYDAVFRAFEATAGGCDNVKRVRDPAALQGACFDYFEGVACADLLAAGQDPAKLPSACHSQLLR